MADSDVAAFEASSGAALVRFAYVLTGDAEVAQDLVQDLMVQLLRRGGLHGILSPDAYARRTLVNAHVSAGRRRQLLQRALPRLLPVESPTADETVPMRDVMWRALEQLSPRHRAALVLRYYEGMSDEAIAGCLHCAPSTVRSSISRALRQLRTAHPNLQSLANS